jgi:hypothetical protein
MIKTKKTISFLSALLNRCRRTLGGIFYGLTAYELELEINKEKGYMNNLLMVMIFGDLAGLPFFPPYSSMRLLPYVIPYLGRWKRSILRERDLMDLLSADL